MKNKLKKKSEKDRNILLIFAHIVFISLWRVSRNANTDH